MLAGIFVSLKLYGTLFAAFVAVGLFVFVAVLAGRWLFGHLQPVFSQLGKWVYQNILQPLGSLAASILVVVGLAFAGAFIFIGHLCLAFWLSFGRYLLMMVSGSAFWLLVWWVWDGLVTRPFLPHAIAATIIGVSVMMILYCLYCHAEKQPYTRHLDWAIAGAFGGLSPVIAFFPLLAVAD